ncbi:Leucine-rich receptor-like protein kinase family protein [Euphorbia peplus]|nr:Leucine-rich receptor-like protein kinase family protein [Euphorbia peplus]
MKQYLLLIIAVIFLPQVSIAATNGTSSTDQSALLALKVHISYDPHNFLRNNWSITSPVCSWIGVTCGQRHQRVVSLNLSYMNLSGTIPSQISNLSFLAFLSLRSNNFYGHLTHELGLLRRLKFLDLGFNFFFGNLPPALCNMSRLEVIDANGNNLSGNLPPSIGLFLPNLVELRLAENALEGTIPNSISNASRITHLDLSINSFTGFFPSTFGDLRYLQTLNLGNNQLTSDSSAVESSLLSSLENCRHLQKVILSDNMLNAALPVSFGNLSSTLEEFTANNCNITGSIPRDIGNLINLIALSWENNHLTGTIPSKIATLQNIQGLFLQGNNLEGSIGNDICNMPNLAELSLARNRLSGAIPKCLGNLTTLRLLDLSSNKFTSEIPSTMWILVNILVVNMSSNFLIGNLSLDINTLKSVVIIDFSMNKLSGEIPATIGALQSVAYLSVANNFIQGPIPESLSGLVSLESLDLSHNHLSGVIPKSLEALKYLSHFNVSFNGLQGEIPVGGPFVNFSAQSYIMNKALCGPSRLQLPPCKAKKKAKKFRIGSFLRILLPIIASIGLVYYAFECLRMRKRNISRRNTMRYLKSVEEFELHLHWIDRGGARLNLWRATDGYNEDNLIGTGHFASVYKGICEDGSVVAIKVYNLEDEKSLRSFNVECSILEIIRDRNVIRSLGSYDGCNVKALVMEYMSNGSLEKWLHTHNYNLDILQRIEIMMDVASAVKRFHGFSVVHCDLKPSNVLLGEDMIARVCDFGISRDPNSEETTHDDAALMCTFGYVAPEYGLHGTVSEKIDVYSFGILVLETFTGKRPTDEIFSGEMSLRQWVLESLPSHVDRVADPSLLNNEEQHFNAAKLECLANIMTLAISCSAQSPLQRYDMSDVLGIFNLIHNQFLKSI